MNISGQTSIQGNGTILTGYYAYSFLEGGKPRLFEFSSASYGMGNFSPPHDAYLPNRLTGGYIALARRIRHSTDSISSNVSGALYYYASPSLIGTCHGFGRDNLTYYSGYNFYNAFYPAGYFQPPFGETTSLFKLNREERESLKQGVCAPMSITEYNEQFGIISKVATDAGATSDTLNPNTLAQIMSLKETCPEATIAVSTYYEEIQAKQIPGTASSITSPTLYNNNPIPTSLDNYDLWKDGRYQYTSDEIAKKNNITFGADGRPLSDYYSGDTNHSKLNNVLCYAQSFETETMIGRLTNGLQRIETPDVLWGGVGSQVSAAGQEPWHYWHFTFKENAETLPFNSDFKKIREGSTRRTISEGTQMFTPVLSSEDAYWQNRQCPDTVDFLPWTFGASIYACPSYHFDIPYYASIKKFGFYGTRFLNSCKRLNLENDWNGAKNALEVAQGEAISLDKPDVEPEDIDADGNFSFSYYDNLLRTAKAEEQYSNMYALNKGFFLWANSGCILGDPIWSGIIESYNGVEATFNSLVAKFQHVYQSGLSSFISGEPSIISKQDGPTINYSVLDSGQHSDLLFTNDAYLSFRSQLDKLISGAGMSSWESLEDRYAYYISNCNNGIDEEFYANLISGREKRIRTRYFENIIRGNPVDLFPMNNVTFATDDARSYLESTGWGRSSAGFSKSSSLPPIQRRYFEGAYGNSSSSSGLADIVNKLSFSSSTAFYPGFFNSYTINKEVPTPGYTAVISGRIQDSAGRKYSASGWLAAGYNEIGQLDRNFSCFTPIFVQQPLPKVFCKIGQHPTLRALAVDYHSIPEDKISYKYPEIIFWAHKLKIINNSFENLYPMQYRWFRVKKDYYESFKTTADFSSTNVEFSSSSGPWCALEGNASTCTIVQPTKCIPPYSSTIESDYTFIKGVELGVDDEYYYFCMAIGRFGVRISEPTELVIENWLRFDVSLKNGMNKIGEAKIEFIISALTADGSPIEESITFKSKINEPYKGYQTDEEAIPESRVEQKIPPPNAGWGSISATRFIGLNGYIGATRTYVPDTLQDTRGLRENWGRMVDYGSLIPFSQALSQREGDLLYGYRHLPTCTNYSMLPGQKGIRVIASINNNLVSHWTLGQQAFAATDKRYGMAWDKIDGIGSLYPPSTSRSEILSPPSVGIGHWQWGTNLGSIKRFGQSSRAEDNDLVLRGPGISSSTLIDPVLFKKIKEKFVRPTTLAGTNCGYSKYGLGRNMLYYIEAFDRYYLICDPVKKKNVANLSFMCPGLRFTNSAIQYFWLGQPSNTYVERRPMYGPYAYQWKVKRHNRDRNGNGISKGFYSMNYETNYEQLYDAPAIYGLYLKQKTSPTYKDKVNRVKLLREKVIDLGGNLAALKTLWFGEAGDEGTYRRYGSYTFSCNQESTNYNSGMCEYVSAAKDLANTPDFTAYSCPEDRLRKGECFDPCLSIRYGQGFFPGGKSQNMFGYTNLRSANLEAPHNLQLVSQANFWGETLVTSDETIKSDPYTMFRSPINTPHARVWRGLQKIEDATLSRTEDVIGISPCKDGGSDHCNYMTATIHLDKTTSLLGLSSKFNGSMGFASSIYVEPSERGE